MVDNRVPPLGIPTRRRPRGEGEAAVPAGSGQWIRRAGHRSLFVRPAGLAEDAAADTAEAAEGDADADTGGAVGAAPDVGPGPVRGRRRGSER